MILSQDHLYAGLNRNPFDLPAHPWGDIALAIVPHHPGPLHGPHHAGVDRNWPLDAGAVEVMGNRRRTRHPRLPHAMSLLHGHHLLSVQLGLTSKHGTSAAGHGSSASHGSSTGHHGSTAGHAGWAGPALAGGRQLGARWKSLLDLTYLN